MWKKKSMEATHNSKSQSLLKHNHREPILDFEENGFFCQGLRSIFSYLDFYQAYQ